MATRYASDRFAGTPRAARLLDAAASGSVLVSAIEHLPAAVQMTLIDMLAGLESSRPPAASVRLISGTTVSLLERVAAGAFSERLFYRLNIIHLMAAASLEVHAHASSS